MVKSEFPRFADAIVRPPPTDHGHPATSGWLLDQREGFWVDGTGELGKLGLPKVSAVYHLA